MNIGIVLPTKRVRKEVTEFISWCEKQDCIHVSCVIIEDYPLKSNAGKNDLVLPSHKLLSKSFRGGYSNLFKVFETFEKRALRIGKLDRNGLTELSKQGSFEIIHARSFLRGSQRSFQPGFLAKLKSLDLDLLIDLGNGGSLDEILNVTTLGALKVRIGKNGLSFNSPEGFWEVYNRESHTQFAILSVKEAESISIVIEQGSFATQRYFSQNRLFIYKKALSHMKLAILRLAGKLPLKTYCEIPCDPQIEEVATPKVLAKYCSHVAISRIKEIVRAKVLGTRDVWSVAYAKQSWKDFHFDGGTEIANPKNGFLADPFLVTKVGRTICFVEEFDFSKKKGFISAIELTENCGAVPLGSIISEPFHMSFPYIFEYKSKLYMCPETGGNRDIRIYECTEFPLKWEFKLTLMKDVKAADTIIFQRNKKWWLFTTIDSANSVDNFSELNIFSAKNPLSDHWIPHTMNPVIIDAKRGRNGGFISEGNCIYRVAQNQGFRTYGESFSIYKIMDLSQDFYSEELVQNVLPNFKPRIVGTHHLNSNGEYVVYDFLRNSRPIDKAS